jgi:hypothetical protein
MKNAILCLGLFLSLNACTTSPNSADTNATQASANTAQANTNATQTNTSAPAPAPQAVDWDGFWSCDGPEQTTGGGDFTISSSYRLKIQNGRGTLSASGIQLFFDIEGRAVNKGNTLEFYYERTVDGAFFQEDRVNKNSPLITLRAEGGKVYTSWQASMNMNDLPKDCFQKK